MSHSFVPLLGCAVLLVASSASAELVVESLTGPVTNNEVSAFKDHMAGLEPADSNEGNAYAYGRTGMNVEALGAMFEVTGDGELMDRMLHFTDHMLAQRNDRTPAA